MVIKVTTLFPSPWCRVPTCWRHTNGWISNTGSRLGLIQRNLWLQGGVNLRAHKGCRTKRSFAPTEGMTPMRRAVQLLFTGAAKFRAGTVGLRCWLVSLLDSSRSVAAVWKSLKRPRRAEPDGTQKSDDSWCSLLVQHGPVRGCTGCAASIVLLKLGALLFFVFGMKDLLFKGIRKKHETRHFGPYGEPRPSFEKYVTNNRVLHISHRHTTLTRDTKSVYHSQICIGTPRAVFRAAQTRQTTSCRSKTQRKARHCHTSDTPWHSQDHRQTGPPDPRSREPTFTFLEEERVNDAAKGGKHNV